MPLAAAGIAPHGFPIIPVLSDDADGALETRRQMHHLGAAFTNAAVEAVIIAGPHGIRVEGSFAVVDAARVAGTLHWNGALAEMNAPCDRPLIESLVASAVEYGLPVSRVSYAGNRPDQAVAPLDWGAMTPMWFIGHDHNESGSGNVLTPTPEANSAPGVVLVTPSRSLPATAMIEFGRAIGRALEGDVRNVGFIASCDWAHTHREDGPYGFHASAAQVDRAVVDALRRNDPGALLELDRQDIESAAIDGLWQTLMLAGVQEIVPLTFDVLSYEAPAYYGMIVATAMPDGR